MRIGFSLRIEGIHDDAETMVDTRIVPVLVRYGVWVRNGPNGCESGSGVEYGFRRADSRGRHFQRHEKTL